MQSSSPLGSGLMAYVQPKTLVMLALGFASGLPLSLLSDTLAVWLRDAHVSLEIIGFFALVTLSYSLKFIWAPLIDRVNLPVLTKMLGHRRGWMLLCQILIISGLCGLSLLEPQKDIVLMAVIATLIGFAAATQDVVMDAWRIEAVAIEDQGILASAYQWGAGLARLAAGLLPLLLADRLGWHFSYGLMAALMGIGIMASVFAPRENVHIIKQIDYEGLSPKPLIEAVEWLVRLIILLLGAAIMGAGLTARPEPFGVILFGLGQDKAMIAAVCTQFIAKDVGIYYQVLSVVLGLGIFLGACLPLYHFKTRPGAFLKTTFVMPLIVFGQKHGRLAALILAMICLYRISEMVINLMNPFYLDLGFSKTQIGEMRKVFGLFMTLFGAFVGGWSLKSLGMMRTLLLGAIVGPLSHIGFIILATQGPDLRYFALALALDNIGDGLSATALIAYLSSLTTEGFALSQYALFTSLFKLPGKLISSQSGRIVEGAAKSAHQDGPTALFRSWMGHLPPEAYAKAAKGLSVTPQAMGAGYVTYFIYSICVGLVGLVLTLILFKLQKTTKT